MDRNEAKTLFERNRKALIIYVVVISGFSGIDKRTAKISH